MANVIAVTLETVDEIYQAMHLLLRYGNYLCNHLLIEYLLRIWVSASNNASRFDAPFRQRLSYMLSHPV